MVQSENRSFTIGGMSPMLFGVAMALVIAAVLLGKLPKGMIGAFAVMMTLGAIMDVIGSKTPLVNEYLGGAPLVCIFGTAALVYFGIMPEDTAKIVSDFMKGGGFLNFYIAALICGSILGISSDLLIKAGVRYAFPLIAGVVVACGLAAGAAGLMGYGWQQGIMHIAMPIMGGGMGAGAVPMAQIFSSVTKMETKEILSILIPALALGNVMSIVAAGLLDKLGKMKPSLTGNGHLMKDFKVEKEAEMVPNLEMMGTGITVSCLFFVLGNLLNKFVPMIHGYALMIIAVAFCKIFDLIPEIVQKSCNMWYKFVAKNFTAALLVGIGVAYTDLGAVINAISVQYVVLVAVVVLGAVIGSGFAGMMVGFNFVESALTAGLCMSNMGGTGDVAVLSAAKRMELMPFAQISSRLGGALILIMVSLILPILG
ncbi:2-hydroxycarboxylate transporter family protein [Dethiosulfovibrio salsuginis]|uniref:Na+/citrate or Na+/malate symporter n=1 Tax=Dethiosulfovibrio salsuginis TaxID=561720 RepID=A0A1X7JQL2_9BACT|nr:2-hydroxycarboxylate transporter family protein [Dethiosulfovibrio salsuginis]SMG30552.1 Na+/citrate or Na+/malate symporter [Dethiosulfovibrio salsuginis]